MIETRDTEHWYGEEPFPWLLTAVWCAVGSVAGVLTLGAVGTAVVLFGGDGMLERLIDLGDL